MHRIYVAMLILALFIVSNCLSQDHKTEKADTALNRSKVVKLSVNDLKTKVRPKNGRIELSYNDLGSIATAKGSFDSDNAKKDVIKLSRSDLKNKIKIDKDGNHTILYSDLTAIAKEKGLITSSASEPGEDPDATICSGTKVCICHCTNVNVTLMVYGVPNRCECECDGQIMYINCGGAGCPTYRIYCDSVN